MTGKNLQLMQWCKALQNHCIGWERFIGNSTEHPLFCLNSPEVIRHLLLSHEEAGLTLQL